MFVIRVRELECETQKTLIASGAYNTIRVPSSMSGRTIEGNPLCLGLNIAYLFKRQVFYKGSYSLEGSYANKSDKP